MEDERAFVGEDREKRKKSVFPPSSLLLLAPLESEALALVEGLALSLGRSTSTSEDSPMFDFPPFVTVRYLGPGKKGTENLDGISSLRTWERVLVAGFSGGLSDRTVAGKAYVLSSAIGQTGRVLSFPGAVGWASRLNLELATSVEVGSILEMPEEKRSLHRASHADLADMESYSWMEKLLNVDPDAAVLRVVSDDPGVRLPAELMLFSDEDGRERRTQGVLALLKNPPALARFVGALPALLKARRTLVFLGKTIGETLRMGRR
jgi:hypothetical protein